MIKQDQDYKVLNPINEEELKQSEDSVSKSIELGCETSVDTLSISEGLPFKFKELPLKLTTTAKVD